jgi:uncharacterized protein
MALRALMNKPGYYRIKVTPRQPQTVFKGQLADGTIKIALAAVPEKGKANQELLRYLSEELGFPVSAFRIVSGLTSPLKIVSVDVHT